MATLPYRKATIPQSVRRAVALAHGAQPGTTSDTSCAYCGARGGIYWPRLRSGRPGAWVSFIGLELDHVIPEASGGPTESSNIVLACRRCNRRKGVRSL